MENTKKVVLTDSQKSKLLENLKPILAQKKSLTQKMLTKTPIELADSAK